MNRRAPYHHFLGNGLDAVLLGSSGGMSSTPAQGLDRCYWYKSDVYYADARRFLPGDDPRSFLAAAPCGTNYQLAPLARAWYEPLDPHGEPLPLLSSEQDFSAATAVLTTHAHYPGLDLELRTYLAEGLPALVFELSSPVECTVLAHAAPGLWPEDGEQSDPVGDCERHEQDGWRYSVGDNQCILRLVPDRETSASEAGVDERSAWLRLHGRYLRWGTVLASSRYPDERSAARWGRLPDDLTPAMPTPPGVDVPDPDLQALHSFSMYMFRAMQNRESGGLPVNNLRRTFNSHVFWDGAFVQRALLEAGHEAPAREAWRFLARTREAAAANARDTFNAPGLHWDWETTHKGVRAYVPWMQQRFQVHNTPLLAHMVMADYAATRDRAALEEGYDLLEGAARFVLNAVLVEQDGRLVTRPLVGSHEAAQPVVNDGATVAASLRLLRDVALAARVLGRESSFTQTCAAAAYMLQRTVAALFNGRYFQASRDEDRLNTSSLAPIYPAGVVAPNDSRARETADAYQRLYAGRMAGHGNNEMGFPWSAGVLARILAYQGRSAAAWEQLDLARVALCEQGGCAEYVNEQGQWNMQFFSTAQAALCSALHALLLQPHGAEVRLFPALPAGWTHCGFSGFLVAGLRLDAALDRGVVTVDAHNPTNRPRTLLLRFGAASHRLMLAAGAHQHLTLEDRGDR